MKTVKQLKAEISEIGDRIQNEVMRKAVENRLRKRIVFLNECIGYVETNPDVAFIASEIKRIDEKITLRMKGFDDGGYGGIAKSYAAKAKREYKKQFEVTKLETQRNALKFLAA